MRFKVLPSMSHLYNKPAVLHSEPDKTTVIQFFVELPQVTLMFSTNCFSQAVTVLSAENLSRHVTGSWKLHYLNKANAWNLCQDKLNNGKESESCWYCFPCRAQPKKKKKVDVKKEQAQKERMKKKLKKLERAAPELIPIEDFITPLKYTESSRSVGLPFTCTHSEFLLLHSCSTVPALVQNLTHLHQDKNVDRKYYLFLLKIMKTSAFPVKVTGRPHRLTKLLVNSVYSLCLVGGFCLVVGFLVLAFCFS